MLFRYKRLCFSYLLLAFSTSASLWPATSSTLIADTEDGRPPYMRAILENYRQLGVNVYTFGRFAHFRYPILNFSEPKITPSNPDYAFDLEA